MEELAYNENDGYVGFWVENKPYNVLGTSYFNSGRTYLSPNNITLAMEQKAKHSNSCQDPVPKYFNASKIVKGSRISKKTSVGNIYMNGRRYYVGASSPENKKKEEKVAIPNTKLIDKSCTELSRFNNISIYLHSLVCSQLSDANNKSDFSWVNILNNLTTEKKSCPSICTEIGCKIAKSLIKIAALRIFADPEQSIMEIPVNSIDSYRPDSKVGKFGMGFFSFLYWLIDHPLRVLYIYSWSKNEQGAICGYCATVRDSKNEGLTLSIKILETCVTQTGTLMYLDCKADKFNASSVNKFYDQMERLKNISSVKLFCVKLNQNNENVPDSFVYSNKPGIFLNAANHEKNAKDIVYICIGESRIFVEDHAQGIPINVLLGSLFVPSISTKTIKSSTSSVTKKETATVSYNNFNTNGAFIILVSDVSVVYLKTNSYGSSTISMPSWTRLPVSRDDIILENPEMVKMFENALVNLLEEGVKMRNVSSIQTGIKSYLDYTANFVNKQAVKNALAIFTEKYKSYLVTKSIYDSLGIIDMKCINSEVMYVPEVESRLIVDLSKRLLTNVWYGKRVMLIDFINPSVKTENMSSLVFVNKKLTEQDNWPVTGSQSNPSLNLNPIGTEYGLNKNTVYEKFVPAEIRKHGKIYEELYMAVIAVFDGLNVKFKMLDIYLGMFSSTYTSIFTTYGLNDWVDISYVFLNVLTSYKGNQTYGGGQYAFIYKQPKMRLKISDNLKLMKYEILSMMEAVKSVNESQNTIFCVTNILSPHQIELNFLDLGIDKNKKDFYGRFHSLLLEKTDTLVEYTVCSILFLKSIPNATHLIKNKEESLLKILPVIIDKVKSRNFDLEDLKNLYRVANNYKVENIFILPFPAYMDIRKLYNQTLFLITLSVGNQLLFQYTLVEPKEKYVSKFRISQLIGYLFSNDRVEKGKNITENDLVNIFVGASKYDGKTKLQITEIAINEGTTKDFIPACLTELVQNSVDAIRESDNPGVSRNININFDQSASDTYSFMVGDFVGMPPTAFLHICIPFLSTKTPSEIVTGEMGSGFFNVYRESSLVVIDTNYKGINYTSYDTPIVENGRVVDVLKTVYIKKSTTPKPGTKIIVTSNKVTEEILSENIGTLRYTSENVISQISLFNDINIYINGGKPAFNSASKTHMFTIGHFDVYFMKGDKYPSYVFTKGIPFTLLSNFYVGYDKTVILDVENSIIVNIRHGGYTPVQTRTRLNLSDEAKIEFDILLNYIIFVKNLQLSYDDDKKGWRNWMYPNLESTAGASQLNKQLYVATKSNANSSAFLLFTNFDLLEKGSNSLKTLTYFTNELIKSLGDENPRNQDVMNKLKRVASKFDLSPHPEVRKLGEFLLLKWISNKNMQSKMTQVVKRDFKPDKPDKLMEPYVKIWIETYIDKALSCGIYGWNKSDKFNIEVGESEENENTLGYFDASKKLIYINTITWTPADKKNIISNIKNIKSTFDFQNLPNEKWRTTFSFRYPATVIPHELEHARRKSSHEGSHDITRNSLWTGDISTERTFDQSCNDIFSKIISEGFYDELLKRYKSTKLI